MIGYMVRDLETEYALQMEIQFTPIHNSKFYVE